MRDPERGIRTTIVAKLGSLFFQAPSAVFWARAIVIVPSRRDDATPLEHAVRIRKVRQCRRGLSDGSGAMRVAADHN